MTLQGLVGATTAWDETDVTVGAVSSGAPSSVEVPSDFYMWVGTVGRLGPPMIFLVFLAGLP